MPLSVTITGLPAIEALAARLKAIEPVIGKGVEAATNVLRAGTASRAHVDTGTYAGAQTSSYADLVGTVFTADRTNPLTGQAASLYGPYEEARGGAHAAYANTFTSDVPKAAEAAASVILQGLIS